MTRSVLISTNADPFLILFVHKLFKKYWYNEIDKMYICLNSEMEISFYPELFSRLIEDKKISIIFHPFTLGWGEPIKQMVECSREDLVMLLENDGFIFTPGVVDENFKLIEDGEFDAIGSPRRSCSQEIWDRSKEKYNLNYEGLGDKGPNFWPNFFYCKRSDLLKTDMNFGSIGFKAGDYCRELDYTFKEVNAGDTFVWASMQLRAMGLKFKDIPQNHASPNENEEYTDKIGKWEHGRPPYIHGGSLSSGWSWNGFLLGRQPLPESNGLHEIETRVAFWMLVSDYVEGFTEFKKQYKQGIENLINKGLDRGLIKQKYNIYREAMGL